MSNREYYGDSVPQNTAAFNGAQQQADPAMWRPNGETPYGAQQWSDPNTGAPGYQNMSNQQGGPGFDQGKFGGPDGEGEKGLGSTIVGGTVGGIAGHQVGKKSDHGTLGTIGGALAGAVIANVASHAIKGNHSNQSNHSTHSGSGSSICSSMRDRRRERLERKLDRLS